MLPFHPQKVAYYTCALHLAFPLTIYLGDISISIHTQFPHYFSLYECAIICFISSTVMAFGLFRLLLLQSVLQGIIVFICTSIMNICRINSQKWNCKIKGHGYFLKGSQCQIAFPRGPVYAPSSSALERAQVRASGKIAGLAC